MFFGMYVMKSLKNTTLAAILLEVSASDCGLLQCLRIAWPVHGAR